MGGELDNTRALYLTAELLSAEQRRISGEQLIALGSADVALRAMRANLDLHLRSVTELTSIIATRDAQNEDLEKNAAEKLVALFNIDVALQSEQMRVRELLVIIEQLERKTIVYEEELTALRGEHLYAFLTRRLKKHRPQRTPR